MEVLFDEDIQRAEAIVTHARTLTVLTDSEQLLRDDLLRSAWMFGVGAMDAYFCDAYSDLIARTLRAKSSQPLISLSKPITNVRLPIHSVLSPYSVRENWRWRMAARELMKRDNVLSVDTICKLFNPFFRAGYKLFDESVMDDWIASPNATNRLFGTRQASYKSLKGQNKATARNKAREKLRARYNMIAQRRHDCIHNCDRPKVSPQPIGTPDATSKVIKDVKFLVDNCNKHIDAEFREYLVGLGCNAATLNKLGY